MEAFRESSSRGTTKTAGRSSSLTAPNGPAQQEVILTAWQESGQAPGACFILQRQHLKKVVWFIIV